MLSASWEASQMPHYGLFLGCFEVIPDYSLKKDATPFK